jgi:DNA-binding IclR family transcriptional regulator
VSGSADADGRSVAKRLFAVLDAVGSGRSLTLTEVARRTGLPTSTVQRLLADWTAWGGLVRGEDGRYSIGMKLWRLGLREPGSERLRRIARPYLADLLEATHEHVHLAVLDGLGAVYLERLSGKAAVSLRSDVGSRVPLHATAVGQVLLAHGPPEVLDALVAGGLPRHQRSTITDVGRLLSRLEEIRRTGIGRSVEELTPGAFSVAAPIHDGRGRVTAAVSVIGAVQRVDEPQFALGVRMAARGISSALGWQPRA